MDFTNVERYMENSHLNGNEFEMVQNNKAAILLTHGFTATPVEVKPLGEKLFAAGYDVYAPLIPGHNQTPADLNNTKYTDWISYLENKLEGLFEKYDTVFVSGESMGGLLSCYLAERYEKIAGVILFAPAISIKNLHLLRFLKFVMPYMGDMDKDGGDDEDLVYPWKGYKTRPTHAAFEMYKLQQIVKKDLDKIKMPVLVFQGSNDKTIDVKSSDIVIEKISSEQKELVVLEKSGHCVVLDVQFDEIVEKTIGFLSNLTE